MHIYAYIFMFIYSLQRNATALDIAIENKSTDVIKYLLNIGSDVDSLNQVRIEIVLTKFKH